jgi:hypothetical protein
LLNDNNLDGRDRLAKPSVHHGQHRLLVRVQVAALQRLRSLQPPAAAMSASGRCFRAVAQPRR